MSANPIMVVPRVGLQVAIARPRVRVDGLQQPADHRLGRSSAGVDAHVDLTARQVQEVIGREGELDRYIWIEWGFETGTALTTSAYTQDEELAWQALTGVHRSMRAACARRNCLRAAREDTALRATAGARAV